MIALFCLCLALFASPFKSKSRLDAENAALRHQLIILRRKVRGRVRLTDGDRLFFIQLYRWFPTILKAITIVRPETLVRWHRAGFRPILALEIPLPWRSAANRRGPALGVTNERGLLCLRNSARTRPLGRAEHLSTVLSLSRNLPTGGSR